MAVSLITVIEDAGFNPLQNKDDALWLLSKRSEFEELVEQAEEVLGDE